jgi:GNAT superfamily N-acetyltransferase
MTPRLLVEADLPAARALLQRVELGGGVAYVARYLRWHPEGVWGAFDDDGALVGMISLLQFGASGFVGCMAVQPEQQGRGIGRLLLEHAHAAGRARGIATFLLEATAVGRRLYDKVGYTVEYSSMILVRPPDALRFVETASLAGERPEILALDREAIGAPRESIVGPLVDGFTGAAVRSRGELAGYGLIVGERLGPVIARDPGAGAELIQRLAPGCSNAALPLTNEPAVAAIAVVGFTELRKITRMRLGPPVPIRVPWVWTFVSAGAG